MPSLSYYLTTSLVLLSLVAAGDSVLDSGQAVTERYYDCCKPDCSWPGRADFTQPVRICGADSNPLTDFNAGSSCGDGPAYPCADQSPWAVNDTFSYGFAGVYLMEQLRDSWCCACYELTFTSGEVKGKKMVIQAHNSGFDLLTANRFTLAVPGGNTSYADACAKLYDVPSSIFGLEKEGVTSRNQCNDLPDDLQDGCKWRFDWYKNESRPDADYKRVKCPTVLTDRTGCIRDDDTNYNQTGKIGAASSYSVSSLGLILAAFLGFTL